MGLVITSTDDNGPANLNSLMAVDAVVKESVTPSGRYYATLSAAISAGHKTIAIEPGDYGSLTIATSGLNIIGLGTPIRSGDTFTDGVRFSSTIDVTVPNVTLRNIAVESPGSHGFDLDSAANHCRLIDVQVVDPSQTGIVVTGASNVQIIRPQLFGGTTGGNGIIVNTASASSGYDGVEIIGAYIDGFDGNGILFGEDGSDTVADRYAKIIGGTVKNCASGWGYGVSVQATVRALVQGVTCVDNGDSGIYVYTPSTSPAAGTRLIGNTCQDNDPYGIELQTAVATVVVLGNHCNGNATDDYQNCGSAPGYVTTNTNL